MRRWTYALVIACLLAGLTVASPALRAQETEEQPSAAEPARTEKTQDQSEPAAAVETKPKPEPAPSAETVVVREVVSNEEIMELLRAQQAQIDAQQQQLEQQRLLLEQQTLAIGVLQGDYEQAKVAYTKELEGQQSIIDEQRKTMRSMQAKIDDITAFDPSALTEEEKEFRSRLQTLEESISESREASSTTFDAESFPGSIPIGGSAAAIRIGGFVKANLIQSFDTVGSQDRFIVGTIPTDPINQGDSQAELTVSQSRLNIDLRDNTEIGVLRAFIEGDFAGSGDTFRLRHAFGQVRDILAGKTWSVLVDSEANPEELDFEGINGRINVRQTQFRYFPQIGRDWNLVVSLEDPEPDIANGTGISVIPDFVVSMRRQWFGNWHVKTAAIVRQIEGRWDCDPEELSSCRAGDRDDVFGWGLSISGRTPVKYWNPRDNLMFQLNYGSGYGRYVNDLATVGGGDAAFSPDGALKALPVLSAYASFQKWWLESLRSTFIISGVDVDNYSWQPAEAYKRTSRVSGNVIWSPTARVDLGGELLWGKREDKDGGTGTATQVQLSVKYRF